MFTGLVEEIGRIARLDRRGPGARVVVEMRAKPLVLGESIAVDGVCLTVDRITPSGFEADASSETLARTTLGAKSPGDRVHLERATPLGGRMGGHIVTGHVDGLGRVTELRPLGEAWRLALEIHGDLAPYVATKGSIALDGVSLTLNGVVDRASSVLLELVVVPHTLGGTKLGALGPGDAVNVEVDVLARYVARQLAVGGSGHVSRPADASEGTSHERRAEHGTGSVGEDRDDSLLRKLREGGFA